MMSGHKSFACVIGTLLIFRGIAGFLMRQSFMGLSATANHNFLHILVGIIFIWVGVWATRLQARAWNKFLGWFYLFIGTIGVMDVGFMTGYLGANTALDDIFNFMVAFASLTAGYFGTDLRHYGRNWMRENNWPWGRT